VPLPLRWSCWGLAGALTSTLACSANRAPTPTPVFDQDVAPILAANCTVCHSGASPAAGWSADSFLGAIGCVSPSGSPASLPASNVAPILAVLRTPSHLGFLNAADLATLTGWIKGGSLAFQGTVHAPGIVDPRSPAFHATLLRSQRWTQMLDAQSSNACGQCHDGTLSRPASVTSAAPGATACTSCHDQPGGVLACGTCHGDGARDYPPRNLCFFPADAKTAGAHAPHVESSADRAGGYPCSTCHPVPSASPPESILTRGHGDGTVLIKFDQTLIQGEASFDASTGACAVACHDLGGNRPRPTWTDPRPVGCNDCHLSPPAGHFPGSCTGCHSEANSTGTALSGGPLHLDGRVELGNGSGECGACHGTGASPWPSTLAHPRHQNPTISSPVACSDCHIVPAAILSPGHLDGVVHVDFSGLATARGAVPVWNGASCTEVACHGANLPAPAAVTPTWADTSGAAAACGACHGIPPTAEHTPSTACSQSFCHGSEVGTTAAGLPAISTAGESLHINGVINVGP
jgi:predicted CxxxxCH...CXXCH cytochrome family protein